MADVDDPRFLAALMRSPKAHSVQVFFCQNPECHRPHVVLLDTDHMPFAQFVVPDPLPDQGFFFDLKGALYRSAVERGSPMP